MYNIHYIGDNTGFSGFILAEEEAKSDGMKKGLGMIVGFVAMIIIPYASPAIAGAVGMTAGTIGFTAVSAISGAVIGAGLQYAAGGDPWSGAIMGGLGGLGAGLNVQTPGSTSAAPAPAATSVAAPAATALSGSAQASNSLAGVPAAVPGVTLGAEATATPLAGLGAGVTAPTGSLSALTNPGTAGVPSQVPGVSMGPVTPQQPGLLTQLGNRLTDQNTMRGISGALNAATAPESAEMRAARAALLSAEQRNAEARRLRMQTATGLLYESKYYDPAQGGQRAATQAKIVGGETEEAEARRAAATRGYNTGAREIQKRQAGLKIGRDAGAAFTRGSLDYKQKQNEMIAAAERWMPTDDPSLAASWQALASGPGNDDERYGNINGWLGVASTAGQVYRPSEQDQWPTDNVGVRSPRG